MGLRAYDEKNEFTDIDRNHNSFVLSGALVNT